MKLRLNSRFVLCVISSIFASNSSIFLKYASLSPLGALTASCKVSAKITKLVVACSNKGKNFLENDLIEKLKTFL